MIRRIVLFGLILASPLNAGLWDSDRPENLPSAYDAIGGRFDQFPPEYYQHRLDAALPEIAKLEPITDKANERQIEQIAATAALFDQAAVAHFRRGEFADAIILLDRKNQLLNLIQHERTATARQHRMKALANKAACLHHRWRKSGSSAPDDLGLAREILADLRQSDEYNADARWSLLEISWLTERRTYEIGADPVFTNMLALKDASFRGSLDEGAVVRNGLGGCIPWLTRRITYEDGWNDVDLFYAYSLALFLSGRKEESLFAWFRVCELIDEGHTTRVINAPGPKTLKRLMGVHLEGVEDQTAAGKLYRKLREECDRWRKSRNAYLLTRIGQGKHPDTQADFWSGWRLEDPGTPEPGRPATEESAIVSPVLLLGGLGGLILVLVLIFGAAIFMSRKGPAPSVDEL